MQPLPTATEERVECAAGPTPEAAAALLLEVMPAVMREVKARMRHHRDHALSVPQFRALAAVGAAPSSSLSAVADYVGLSLPAVSRMVDDLERAGLLRRDTSVADRRRLTLTLTAAGEWLLTQAREATQAHLAGRLARLTPEERATIVAAMRALAAVFVPHGDGRGQHGRV